MTESTLRELLLDSLGWAETHVPLDRAVSDLHPTLRGARAEGFPHSVWDLLEHIRIAQHDILDFCRNSDYEELQWPDQYWPESPAPPSSEAWDQSILQTQTDRAELQAMAADPDLDLTAIIPHGTGQTYFRELLLVADHTSYHVGQIVAVRKILGAWNG